MPVPNLLGVAPLLGVGNPTTGGTDATAAATSPEDSTLASALNICIGSIFPFPFVVLVFVLVSTRRKRSDSSVSLLVDGIRSLARRSSCREVKIPSRNLVD